MEHVTLDLRVLSSSSTVGVEFIKKKKKISIKQICILKVSFTDCILHQYGGCIGDKNAEREAGEEVLQLSA